MTSTALLPVLRAALTAYGDSTRSCDGRPWSDLSLIEQVSAQDIPVREAILSALSDAELLELQWSWAAWARPGQLRPTGVWSTWILRAGRGYGKTRAGAGCVHEWAINEPGIWVALVARTPADARDYMIEGPGGFLDKLGRNIRPDERPHFHSSKRRLTWPNGSWATLYSDEEPDQLRGFSGRKAWLDELGKFQHPQEVWDNLQFGMREAGIDNPQRVLSLTPKVTGKANQLLKKIEAMPSTVVTRGVSYDNRANLDPTWFSETIAVYEGTKTGREEIYGELLNPEEQGIVKRSYFKLWPATKPLPKFEYIILSLDTAFTEDTQDRKTHEPDPTAAQVWGLFHVTLGNRPKAVPRLMLLDCWDEFLGFPDLIARVRREMKIAYGQADAPLIPALIGPKLDRGQGRTPDLLVIEDKGSGISLRQTLAREGLEAYPFNPGRADKLARLHMVSHIAEKGYCYLVESENRPGQPRTWTENVLDQICTFRGEGSIAHDDHVDAFTQVLRVFLAMHLIQVTDDETETPSQPIPDSPFGKPLIPHNVYAQ